METYIFIALLIISTVFIVKVLYFEDDINYTGSDPEVPPHDPLTIPVKSSKK